jgi:micrococcal nuclease
MAKGRILASAIALAAAGLALAPAAGAFTLDGTVVSVVDGDTLKVRARGELTTVRLVGIDTPETRHPSKPVQCFGPAATKAAKRLLRPGQAVRLVTDPTQDTRDRYGRLLAYVYPKGKAGSRGSVNFTLVAHGAAKVYVYGGVPFEYAGTFQAAQGRARTAGVGLWGGTCHGNTTKPDPSVARPAPTPPPPAPSSGNCDPNYAGACVPLSSSDLDCKDIPGTVRVVGSDPHRLDGDHDGWGCEANSG